MGLIILALLVVLLLGALPRWRYSQDWGYQPTQVVGLLLVVVLILVVAGYIPGTI
ncbi:DUF3309 family protein [Limnoglobus roseus]|uniref:DUF3309 domain-containing protein n=1 Tax=Limnoglobus roseus TaxID=2598579 RepID=A0A5C1AKH0_9BACT|nr:DUF3309 family protein [Limnoglobus roseus]QEL19879.1 hypothetical protein PX52LOC_06960 [Limnoglobus roseus]